MNMYNFLQPMLSDAVSNGVFPSAVVAVGCRETVFATCAAGDANVHTRYDMASMTKIMATTMIALRALEEGQLTLFDTVSQYFDAPEDKAGLTIFQLMTHTAGFTPTFHLSDEIDNPADAVDAIFKRPLEAIPDGVPRYSCMGYILLGKILESIYSASLKQIGHDLVFGPLHMKNTAYTPNSRKNIAPTEISPKTGIAWQGVVHDENARFLNGVSGNAGIFSNIDDCIRFAQMLSMGGNGFLSPATLKLAISNHTPGHEAHRGLGFQLGGTPLTFMGDLFPPDSFGHTGFTGTSLVIDPSSGLYVVLLTNRVHPTRTNEKLFRFRLLFHNRIYAAFSREVK